MMGSNDRKKHKNKKENKTSNTSEKNLTGETNPEEHRKTPDKQSSEKSAGPIEKRMPDQKSAEEVSGKKANKYPGSNSQHQVKIPQDKTNGKENKETPEKDDVDLDVKFDRVNINVSLKMWELP